MGTVHAEWNEPVSAEHGMHPILTVAAGKLGVCTQAQVMSRYPHRAPPRPSLGPWSSAVLAPRARVGVSTWGCFRHHFLEHMVLQERQHRSASGKHPKSQQTPFPHLRKISIFMSLITPLKLLCECSNSKSSTRQRQILRPLGNQEQFLRLPCSVPVLLDLSCVSAPLVPRQ